MATITERFGFTKPAGSDPASIVPLNSNTDLIEQYLGRTQDMIAPMYDDTATYDVGDIVTYESNLYKCITAISTAETFDPTKWEATTAVEEGSGGGGGSSVIPNPTGTPTDTLSTVSIDGTIYGIEGGGSISGEGVEIYSEDEYIIGKWTDGKKLYQKTVNLGTLPAQGNTKNVAHNITDLDTVVDLITFAKQINGSNQYQLPWISRIDANAQIPIFINDTNIVIANGSNSSINADYIGYSTIRYTKTVETPAPAWGGSVTNNYANFIDTDNVIQAETQVSSGTTGTYTATEDCYIRVKLWRSSEGGASLSIDGVEVLTNYSNSGTTALYNTMPLKKGQTATIDAGAGSPCSYTVYGITYASGGSETPATDASEVEYDNTTSQLTADNVQEAIDEVVANAGTASEDILTLQNVQGYDEYDETQTYAVGDYAIYNNIVYECTTAVTTAEPFDSTKWTATSIEQIIDGVKGDVSQLNSSITEKRIDILLHDTSSVPTTATSYNLLHDINDYDCIYVLYKYSNNVINGVMVPVDYFLITSSGARIQMPLFTSNGTFQSVINVYYHTDTSVYLQARDSVVSSSNYKVSIYGIKF